MPFSVDYIAQVCPCGCFVALCMCTSRCGLFCAMLCNPPMSGLQADKPRTRRFQDLTDDPFVLNSRHIPPDHPDSPHHPDHVRAAGPQMARSHTAASRSLSLFSLFCVPFSHVLFCLATCREECRALLALCRLSSSSSCLRVSFRPLVFPCVVAVLVIVHLYSSSAVAVSFAARVFQRQKIIRRFVNIVDNTSTGWFSRESRTSWILKRER